MQDDFHQLFSRITRPIPPADLLAKIMQRVNRLQRVQSLRWRIGFFATATMASLVAFVPAYQNVHTAFVESGFMSFFSLAFSDLGATASHWQSVSFALAESFPVIGIVMLLSVVLVFLESLKYFMRNVSLITT